jgi:membrane protein required for colicin V production
MLIDIIFVLILIMAIFRGISKGLVVGIISFFAVIIGLAAALKLSVVVAEYLKNSVIASTKWLPLISFVLVFLVVLLLVSLLARFIKKSLQFAMLGWLDSIGGIILYICLYTIIFSIILFYINRLLLLTPDVISNSKTYPYIAPWGPKVSDNMGKIIPVFKNMFAELGLFFEGIAKKASTQNH